MTRGRGIRLAAAVLGVALAGAALLNGLAWRADEPPAPPQSLFISRDGDRLILDGRPFAAAGGNNYRPMFVDQVLVDDIMRTAAENNFQVMRVWGFNDIGRADGTGSVDRQNATTYFHFWDGERPAYNDGPSGLEKLDYVVASAKRHNIRLVIPFVNNWASFGGMDQYVRWAGTGHHSDFYTDPTIRQWYRDWVSHLLERTNSYTGVAYKNEPTIAVWELANEPRCGGAGQYPSSPDCTTATITAWATEMAAHVKAIDRRHLLGLGDEGFLCEAGSEHFAYDCGPGVDGAAIARLADIDLVGLHLYPDHWRTDPQWATDYIRRHLDLADDVGKPVFLGEYGWRGPAPRNAVFHEWLTTFPAGGGDVALYWQMQPRSELSTPPDSDGFTAYCPSAVCTQVNFRSQAMSGGRTDFPPVADVDFLAVAAGGTATVDLLANDISPFSRIDPATVDLDPNTAGIQQSFTTSSGSLSVSAGQLTYIPSPGYTGRVDFTYAVSDVDGRTSAVTTGVIRVS